MLFLWMQKNVETSTQNGAGLPVNGFYTYVSTPEGAEHTFAPVKGRYVSVNMLKNSANPGVHLNEIAVFAAE